VDWSEESETEEPSAEEALMESLEKEDETDPNSRNV
jgi:hypothetical protein